MKLKMNLSSNLVLVSFIACFLICSIGFWSIGVAESNESRMVFRLAWSEYPSWSTFGVAGITKVVNVGGKWLIDKKNGELIINGAEGKFGVVEKKWKVDIVLKELKYDPCITLLASLEVEGSCLTNMDVLIVASSIDVVAILPTSTSYGADACIVRKNINSVQQLKDEKISTYMLDKSVSQYCFARGLEELGEKEHLYKIFGMDPEAAATGFQTGNFSSIVVWNPFVLQTLEIQPDSYVLFDSTLIPGEIVDMVHMSKKALESPGGENAACAIIEAYYIINELLANPDYQDDMLVALGEKFSDLGVASMKKVVRQTRFYATPEQGYSLLTDGVAFPWKRKVASTTDLFTNNGFDPKSTEVTSKTFKDIMPLVIKHSVEFEMVDEAPTIGYGTKAQAPNVQVRFDPSYIQKVIESR